MRLETFLVRIWTGSDSDGDSTSTARRPDMVTSIDHRSPEPPPDAMRGLVRHVRSGSETTFASESDLLAILRTSMAPAAATTPAGPARVPPAAPVGHDGSGR